MNRAVEEKFRLMMWDISWSNWYINQSRDSGYMYHRKKYLQRHHENETIITDEILHDIDSDFENCNHDEMPEIVPLSQKGGS